MRETLILAVVFAGVLQSSGIVTNNLIAGKTDWCSPSSYLENRKPNMGDVVVVSGEAVVSDLNSFSLVSSLGAINLADNATLTMDVSGTVTAKCAVCGYAVKANGSIGRSGGKLVKTGEGTLVFSVDPEATIAPNYLMDGGMLEIRNGRLKAPSNFTSGYCNVGTLAVSNGATFFLAGGHSSVRTYVSSLYGDGCVTNEASAEANFQVNSTIFTTFSGSICGNVKFGRSYGRIDLVGIDNIFTYPFVLENGLIGVKKFGMKGEPSSIGVGATPVFSGAGGFKSLGSGVPAETTDKDFLVQTSGRVYIDGGTNANLTLTGSIRASSASIVAQRTVELRGEADSYCTVAGNIEDIAACPVYIVKKGLGTWRISDIASYRSWSGGLSIENGTLLFDSLEEKGHGCALGFATNLYAQETTALAGVEHAPYAYSFGGPGTEGVWALNGEEGGAVWCTTRPAVLKGNARFVNNTSRRFRFAGISGLGEGLRTLTLDGSSANENVVGDVSDGENGCTLSIVKEGSGTWDLDGINSFSGSLSVRAGTLVVRNPSDYRWLRWTLRATHGDDFVQAYEFGVYDADGNRLNQGVTAIDDFAAIAPGQAAYQNRLTYFESNYDNNLSYLFDGDTSYTSGTYWMAVRYKNGNTGSRTKLDEGNPATYMPIVMRLPDSAGRMDSYDITRRNSTRAFESYLLEASVDGIHWDVLTNATDVARPTQGASYSVWVSNNGYYSKTTPHFGMKIPGGPAIVRDALSDVGIVSVASGAVLKADGVATISALKIDSEGAGTIDGFTFGKTGTIILDGFVRSSEKIVLPGTYVNATGLSNVAQWNVEYSDGRKCISKIKAESDKLVLLPPGLVISVR